MQNDADTSWVQKKYLDIQYASESRSEYLDIYYPNEGTGPFPVIVVIHGGAFKFGDKQDAMLNPMLEGLKKGYAVVSINYRLSGEAKWPAQINDVKAAIKFIRANAQNLEFQEDKIAVWGGLAGGNLAALAGTSGDTKALEDPNLGHNGVSAKVQAVVDYFGPMNFLTMDDQWKVLGVKGQQHDDANSYESKLTGQKITETPRLVETSNPISYIDGNEPPFFIQCGTNDKTALPLKIKEFADILQQKSKNEVTFEYIKESGHGDQAFETKDNLDKIFAFLDRHLK
ncbi:MAG: hypothetical protein A2X47_02755 [Lentisphaerae bacterium GWF2_38_69]|nr:MAG: hypothetical protein A2X47_02755 [Lentisphaerae bacterium GWF2_38_69]